MVREMDQTTEKQPVGVAIHKIEVKEDQTIRLTYRFWNDTAEPVYFLDRNPEVIFEDNTGTRLTFRHSLSQRRPPFIGFPAQKFLAVKGGEERRKTYTFRHPGVALPDGARIRACFGWGSSIDAVKCAQGRTGYSQIIEWQTLVESDFSTEFGGLGEKKAHRL